MLDAAGEDRLATAREKLLAARAGRVRPGWDDKVLVDWNGLMISALAEAAMAFERPDWLELAARAFRFIRTTMMKGGRLFHAWRAGKLQHAATLDDHAHLATAALALHEATGEAHYLDAAQELAALLDEHFWDKQAGGYFMTADDVKDVIQRPKSAGDNATPGQREQLQRQLSLARCDERRVDLHQRAERDDRDRDPRHTPDRLVVTDRDDHASIVIGSAGYERGIDVARCCGRARPPIPWSG
jgi:hypothetical protein